MALEQGPAADDPDDPADGSADEIARDARERDRDVGREMAGQAVPEQDDVRTADRPGHHGTGVQHHELARRRHDRGGDQEDEDRVEAVVSDQRRQAGKSHGSELSRDAE